AYGMATRVQEWAQGWSAECTSLTPTALKRYATGAGNAKKPQMQAAAAARFPHYDPTADSGADEADALLLLAWALDGFPEGASAKRSRKAKTP
ncbi:MAG TPA: hypothetical protein VEI97_09775, partial [bacterium]|nr:hypothetical protein [bacterium]